MNDDFRSPAEPFAHPGERFVIARPSRGPRLRGIHRGRADRLCRRPTAATLTSRPADIRQRSTIGEPVRDRVATGIHPRPIRPRHLRVPAIVTGSRARPAAPISRQGQNDIADDLAVTFPDTQKPYTADTPAGRTLHPGWHQSRRAANPAPEPELRDPGRPRRGSARDPRRSPRDYPQQYAGAQPGYRVTIVLFARLAASGTPRGHGTYRTRAGLT